MSKYYFRIISKSSEKSVSTKTNKEIKIKQRSQLSALVKKETKRYFSSTVYMFNTLVGVVLLLIATIAMSVNFGGTIEMITEGEDLGIDLNEVLNLMPKIFFGLIIATTCLTSITSSSISLEGKNFYILKSLPVKFDKILLGKILSSNLITMPAIFISDIVFFVAFKPEVFDAIAIILISIIMPTLIGIIGLLVNLKYPKMNATSDTEVVKQSTSSMVAVLGGMIIATILIVLLITMSTTISSNMAIIIELLVLAMATAILYKVLQKYGGKRIKKIN